LSSEHPATVAAVAVDDLVRRFSGDPISQLIAIREARRSLLYAERTAVRTARKPDLSNDPLARPLFSWRTIGSALGIGPSAAWRRHRHSTQR
jgi:hypothetical protein